VTLSYHSVEKDDIGFLQSVISCEKCAFDHFLNRIPRSPRLLQRHCKIWYVLVMERISAEE